MLFSTMCLSIVAVGVPRQPLTDEFDSLKGEWKVEGIAWNSKVEPFYGKQTVEIDTKRITFFDEGGKKRSLKNLNVTDGKIDLQKEYRPFDSDTLLGLYELKKDELRICYRIYGTPSQKKYPPPRPTEIASPKESDVVVYVLKRIKKE